MSAANEVNLEFIVNMYIFNLILGQMGRTGIQLCLGCKRSMMPLKEPRRHNYRRRSYSTDYELEEKYHTGER